MPTSSVWWEVTKEECTTGEDINNVKQPKLLKYGWITSAVTQETKQAWEIAIYETVGVILIVTTMRMLASVVIFKHLFTVWESFPEFYDFKRFLKNFEVIFLVPHSFDNDRLKRSLFEQKTMVFILGFRFANDILINDLQIFIIFQSREGSLIRSYIVEKTLFATWSFDRGKCLQIIVIWILPVCSVVWVIVHIYDFIWFD